MEPPTEMLESPEISLPEPLVAALKQAGMPIPSTMSEVEQIVEVMLTPRTPQKGRGVLSGEDLVKDPDGAIRAYRAGGGTDGQLVRWYLSGDSPMHLLRNGTQPAMLKAALRAMVMPLAKEICKEAGVEGVGAMLLAEQVVEARCDESYLRTLVGIALDKTELPQAERYERMANRASKRMMDALDRLHRLRRPKVNVRIDHAQNVAVGEQQVVSQLPDVTRGGPR